MGKNFEIVVNKLINAIEKEKGESLGGGKYFYTDEGNAEWRLDEEIIEKIDFSLLDDVEVEYLNTNLDILKAELRGLTAVSRAIYHGIGRTPFESRHLRLYYKCLDTILDKFIYRLEDDLHVNSKKLLDITKKLKTRDLEKTAEYKRDKVIEDLYDECKGLEDDFYKDIAKYLLGVSYGKR